MSGKVTAAQVVIDNCNKLQAARGERDKLFCLVRNQGICRVMRYRSDGMLHTREVNKHIQEIMMEVCHEWEHYSGMPDYPVQSLCRGPMNAFYSSQFNKMWVDGEYANRRWELVALMKARAELILTYIIRCETPQFRMEPPLDTKFEIAPE